MSRSVSIAVAAAIQLVSWTAAAGACVPGDAEARCLGMRAPWVYSDPVAIPDGDPTGVTIGPLAVLGESAAIDDVILGIEVSHPAPGDLTMALHYDADNDGTYEASSDIEIYLARPTCEGAELWACPIELDGTYYFHDEGWEAAGERVSFSSFNGLRSGGSFYLSVTDARRGESGTVSSWMVAAKESGPRESDRTIRTVGR